MALLPIELVESNAILDVLIADCESHGICISLWLNCVHDCHSSFSSCLKKAPCKPVLTGQLHHTTMIVLSQPIASCAALSIANDVIL